eukprot:762952-Hanusia_phi.AAC.3
MEGTALPFVLADFPVTGINGRMRQLYLSRGRDTHQSAPTNPHPPIPTHPFNPAMFLTHTDGHTRVPVGSSRRISDLEVFSIAQPFLNRDLRIHFCCGQCVRVYDENELKIIARMLSAYYSDEAEQDDCLRDPFFSSSVWNESLFECCPEAANVIPSDCDQARDCIQDTSDTILHLQGRATVFIPKYKIGSKPNNDTGIRAESDGPGTLDRPCDGEACGHHAAGPLEQGEADEGQTG